MESSMILKIKTRFCGVNFRLVLALVLKLGCGIVWSELPIESLDSVAKAFPNSLSLRLSSAESLFTLRSVDLLAKKYDLAADKASAIQARLWDNPNISIDQNIYNWDTKKYFDMSQNGQTAIALQQLIVTCGKRSKKMAMELAKGKLSELELLELSRNLRHELRQDFIALYFFRNSLSLYDDQIVHLKGLVKIFTTQFQKGNVSLVELSRLQAMLFELEDEKRETISEMNEKQSALNLKLLLPTETQILPVVDTSKWETISSQSVSYSDLLIKAKEGRIESKTKQFEVELNESELSFEKAQRIPDITIGGTWDRNGSYIQNYNSLALSFNIPLWNFNQGNIFSAKNRLKRSQLLLQNSDRILDHEIYDAYEQLISVDSLYQDWKKPFAKDFDELAKGILMSYQKKAIGLLEFVDFFRSYKESKGRLYQLQNRRINAFENINYVVGKEIYALD